jgi:preprotein translocase subunit YajC
MIFDPGTLLALTPAPDGAQQPGWFTLVPFVLIFLIFYFLLIAPARRKQKKHSEMLASLKNGDRIITQGGVLGTVVGVGEQVVQVRIADGVKVEVARHAVAGLQDSPKD